MPDAIEVIGIADHLPPLPNPYDSGPRGAVGGFDPYHPRAEGLSGDALDKLMKSRFTEGVGQGRQEAFAEAERRVAGAFHEGARAGQADGYAHGRAEVLQAWSPVMAEVAALLEAIKAKSGSSAVKGMCDLARGRVNNALEQMFGVTPTPTPEEPGEG